MSSPATDPRVVFKYPLTGDVTTVPNGHVVLVAQQDSRNLPTIWVQHRPGVDAAAKSMDVLVYGTGHRIPGRVSSHHVGSCICGPFVWHVYVDRSET